MGSSLAPEELPSEQRVMTFDQQNIASRMMKSPEIKQMILSAALNAGEEMLLP